MLCGAMGARRVRAGALLLRCAVPVRPSLHNPHTARCAPPPARLLVPGGCCRSGISGVLSGGGGYYLGGIVKVPCCLSCIAVIMADIVLPSIYCGDDVAFLFRYWWQVLGHKWETANSRTQLNAASRRILAIKLCSQAWQKTLQALDVPKSFLKLGCLWPYDNVSAPYW